MSTPEAVEPFSAGEVAMLTGVSYRQLDYWDRLGYAVPSVGAGVGSGNYRRYSTEDVRKIALTKRLLDLGVSLEFIREHGDPQIVVEKLHAGLAPLAVA